ncbi:MAG TPA: TonB-dependent receptor, partial [Pyrinomonadaceae bacterium]|nr:TonB-dependent receptor [Pyrinomonadaceae bacterium]
MITKHAIIVAVLVLLSIGFSAQISFSQTQTTGTLEGVVTDQAGAVVPSVTVTLSGPNLIRPQTATTDENGNYRFASVPPGRYTVDVAATKGFNAYKQENVEVNLARGTTANISLQVAGTGATVDVVATPDIDQSTNVQGSNVSTEFFSNIPTARTVQGLYTIAPTVTRSGLRDASGRERDPSVAGSSGPENSYILDGINTTDPAFGGGGANLPFEFVQEVQIKTSAFGADQGLSTGGVFNVITKTGSNAYHGDVFAYGLPQSFVRQTKNFPFTGLAPNGYSELDAGGDIGGPIIKNRLTFFAAFNPQFRTNHYLTQTFLNEVTGKIKTPFYSGKVTWQVNNNNTFNFSTFGDFTTEKGHLYGQNLQAVNGFGVDEGAFQGTRETGGHNYSTRLNSNISQNWIGEFSFGMHFQRNNLIPATSLDIPLVTDAFAILGPNGAVAPIVQTGVNGILRTGQVDFAYVPGGTLQRNYVRSAGFGLYQNQSRNRWEAAARLQNIWNQHTFKYGFEFYQNKYNIFQDSTGPSNIFANPNNVGNNNGTDLDNRTVAGFRVTNNFEICTIRGTTVACPLNPAITSGLQSFAAQNLAALQAAGGTLPGGATSIAVVNNITAAELNNNPVLVRVTTRVRDFRLNANTKTSVESWYAQDDWRVTKNLQFNLGVRWDLQQALNADGGSYLKLDNLWDTFQPRIGFSWDPRGKGKMKIFANYARFVETPIPLDLNVRAGGGGSQTDKNFNVSRYSAPLNAIVASNFNTRNLGADPTPIDAGLKPQTVNEWTAGVETEVWKNTVFGFRGIYRSQGSVIEDGSFDDGDSYFLFNPGEPLSPGPGGIDGNTEFKACSNPAIGCFGRARRYYRGLEFTLNRRFSNNFSYQMSYVYSSLIGNYEGLFRNDNGQSDPNITSLFDLVSLLANTYGRLPNDRPHQFKFNGSYQTPWRLILSGNFYIQSGTPFNELIPHPVYGNNEGFGLPRGTAIIPDLSAINGNGGLTGAIGSNRSPTTWNLDLGFYYPIKFSESKELRFTADWFNVTNTQRAI